MSKVKQFTADERAQVNEKIENAFAFIEDVIEDPSTLDHIPDKTTIVLTPADRQAARGNYVTETRRFAVSVSNGRRKPSPAADRGGAGVIENVRAMGTGEDDSGTACITHGTRQARVKP